jgi:hypothetical protein
MELDRRGPAEALVEDDVDSILAKDALIGFLNRPVDAKRSDLAFDFELGRAESFPEQVIPLKKVRAGGASLPSALCASAVSPAVRMAMAWAVAARNRSAALRYLRLSGAAARACRY